MKKLKLFLSLLMLLFVGVTSMWATDYELVTSTDDLEAGANYVIGSAASNSAVFMSTATSSNNRSQTEEITITNGKISATNVVLVLELGGSTGAWTFLTTNYTSTNGYLANADSGTGNNCKVGSTARPFTITFDGNKAVITATAGNERNILRYNSGSSCFACYSSGQKDVYLFKEVAVPADPFTVTLMDNSATLTEESAGAGVTLPSRDGCEGYTFAGWTKSWNSAQSSWTTTAPEIIPAGAYSPAADENLYPVYTKTEGAAETWNKITSAPSDWNGDYVLASSGYAMTSDFSASGEFAGASVTITDGKVVTPTDKMIWTFAKNGENAQYSLKNKSTGTYANITGTSSKNAALSESAVWFTISLSSSNVWQIISVTNSGRCFAYYSNNFRTYANSTATNGVDLYKKSGGSTTYYISEPNCCTKHSITIADGIQHGSVSADLEEACEGTTVTLTPTPSANYRFQAWDVKQGETPVSVTNNKFTMPEGDVTVSATFEEDVYAVTITNPSHGTITVKDGDDAIGANVLKGKVLTVSAAANDPTAYRVSNLRAFLTATPATAVAITDGQLTMPGEAITITADETALYAVSVAISVLDKDDQPASSEGFDVKINGGSVAYVASNAEELSLVAADKAGYNFVNWTFDDEKAHIEDPTEASTTAIASASVTITANYKEKSTPELTVSKSSIAFDEISYKGALDAQSFTIEGANLTGDKVTIALVGNGETDEEKAANAAAFSIDEDELAITSKAVNGTITVTPRRDVCGSFSAKLVISTTGISPDKEVALSLTVNKLAHGLVWTPDAATVTIDADDNVFPVLSNPHKLLVELSSSEEDVAYFDDGQLKLKDAGTAKIYANVAGSNDTVTLPAENAVYYTLTVQKKDTVKWFVNGVEIDRQVALAGTDIVKSSDPTKLADDCADMVFKGWAAAPIVGAQDDAPAFVDFTDAKVPADGASYYAVFAEKNVDEIDGDPEWVATAFADLATNDSIVVTNEKSSVVYALPNNDGTSSSPDAIVVTVANSKLSAAPNATLKWKAVKDGESIQFATGSSFLYCTNTNDGVRVGAGDANVFTINNGYLYTSLTTDARYVGVNGTSDWRCYKSINSNIQDATLAFYKKTVSKQEVITYSNYRTTCPVKYTITIANGIQNGTVEADKAKAAEGDEVNLTATPEPGYQLSAWSVNDGAVTVTDNKFTMPASAVTVSATFAQANYTVALLQTGGAEAELTGATEAAHYDDEITVTASAVDGFLFLGWEATGVTLTDASTLSQTFDMPNNNVSLTANYVQILTVAEALDVIDALADNASTDSVYVRGIIKEVTEVNVGYKNATYLIKDASVANELTVFRGKYINNADFTDENKDNLQEGDVVLIKGKLKKYVKDAQTTPEFDQGNYIVTYTEKVLSSVEIGGDATKKTYYYNDSFEFDGLTVTAHYNTGYAQAIPSEDVEWAADPAKVTADGNVNVTATYGGKTSDDAKVVAVKLLENVKWYVNGAESSSETKVAGAALTIPANPENTFFGGYAFAGWATEAIDGKVSEAPEYVNTTGLVMPVGGANYYAVFATSEQKQEVKNAAELAEDASVVLTSVAQLGLPETWDVSTTAAPSDNTQVVKLYNKTDLGGKYIGLSSSSGGTTMTITAPETIESIKLTFTGEAYSQAWVKVGENTIDAVDGVYAINAKSFTIGTNDPTKQVRITNIDVVFKSAAYATNFYAVTFGTPANGTLAVKEGGAAISSGDAFAKGTTLAVEAAPESADYKLTALTANETDIMEAKQFTMGTETVAVAATFAEKADPAILWSAAAATAYTVGKAYTLPTLTNTNELAVTYSSETPATATISNAAGHEGEITLVAAGTTVIKATYAGSDTYKAKEVSYTLTVLAPASVVVTGEAKAEYFYNETFSFEGLGAKAVYAENDEYVIPAEEITWAPAEAPAITANINIEVTATWQGITSAVKKITVTKKLRELSYDEFAWADYATETILLGYSQTPAVRGIINVKNLPAELISYKSGDGSVMEVNAETGVITPKAPGSASMFVKFAGNEEYAAASRDYAVEIYGYDHIALSGEAAKTAYEKGDAFEYAGLVATAVYTLGEQTPQQLVVTDQAAWTIDPENVTADGNIAVTATWREKTSAAMNVAVTVNKHAVTIEDPENGTLVIKNGETPIASGDVFAKGTTLTVTATPASADYKAGVVTVTGATLEGNTITVGTTDFTVAASFAEKADPVLSWSATEATYIHGEVNALPSFSNENNLDITFQSTDENVATVDGEGNVFPKEVTGTTVIKAIYAGDDDYKAKTVSYTLNVKYAPVVKLAGEFTEWGTGALTLTPNEEYTKASVTVAFGADAWPEFKIVVGEQWRGMSQQGYLFHRDWTSAVVAGEGENMQLHTDYAGEYTFTWTYATNTLEISFPAIPEPEYYIAGSFTSWETNWVKMTEDAGAYVAEITISSTEKQEFKVVRAQGGIKTWYGFAGDGTMTSANCENWTIGGDKNIGLQPTKAGDYKFVFTPGDEPKLTVVYPAGGGTGVDEVQGDKVQSTKVLRDNQIFILRGDKTYTIDGQMVK